MGDRAGGSMDHKREDLNEILVIEFSVYKDPWMDNGLENFFRILKNLDSCNIELTNASIKLEVKNKEEFTKELTKRILEKRQNLLVIKKKTKKLAKLRRLRKTT